MRKNKIHSKKLNVFTRYEVEGRNIHALINILKSNGVEIKKLQFVSVNKVRLSVPINEDKKFFAILNELCYNIKEIRKHGLGYPLYFLFKNLGLTVGAIFFIAVTIISNGYIFDFSFKGNGSIYEKEILKKLNEDGIKRFSSFSSFDLKKEAENILKNNSDLIFVSLEKHGNYLVINSNIKENGKKAVEEKKSLIAPSNGVIEEIKLYRGEALKAKGESVKKGEVIVKAKEYQNYSGNVIAEVKISCEYSSVFESDIEMDEDAVLCLAKEILNKETFFEEVNKEKTNKGYRYSVKLKYNVIIT